MNYLVDWSLSFSETYCGGYSGEDPPLPIPNREVKLTIADGTAPPGGRVGSCHFLLCTLSSMMAGCIFIYAALTPEASTRIKKPPEDQEAVVSDICIWLDFFSDLVVVSLAAVA